MVQQYFNNVSCTLEKRVNFSYYRSLSLDKKRGKYFPLQKFCQEKFSMKQMLIIGSVWPEPNSSAAGTRMMQLINCFLDADWQITFACAAARSQYMADIEAIGINTADIKLNDASFDAFISKLAPKIVLFDRFMTEEQFGWRVEQFCPDALRVIDSEDLHCLRDGRFQAHKNNRPFSDTDLFSDTAKREIAAILRSDLTLIISEFEMDLLQHKFKVNNSLLHYTPFMLNPDSCADNLTAPGFADRQGFITIGNFRHAPNMDSIQYLKDSIWPLIRQQLPDAELYVYGAYPTPAVTQLHAPNEGFNVLGRVEDSSAVMQQHRVCLAPLRFGAGLKGKLIEAMQCGTPGVTSSIGAEGMFGEHSGCAVIANDPERFASEAVNLYTNEDSWTKCRNNGWRVLLQRFDKRIHEPGLTNRLEILRQALQEHRLNNFTGAMLRHHGMKSTKYMAKWIEIKNTLKQLDTA